MSQFHIHAAAAEVAPVVLLPGDPDRATLIAEHLDKPRLYNRNRQLLGYTGTYRGLKVSVQTTGMGCPSLAIVAEELVRLGAKTLVRVGTAGIIDKDVRPGDLVVALAAVPADGTTRMYLQGAPYAPTASYRVTEALVAAARALEHRPHVGLIQTEDAFYATTQDDVARLGEIGVLAVEMESSALFLLGKLRRVEVGTLLVASNYIGDPQVVAPDTLTKGITDMIEVALQASLRLERS